MTTALEIVLRNVNLALLIVCPLAWWLALRSEVMSERTARRIAAFIVAVLLASATISATAIYKGLTFCQDPQTWQEWLLCLI